MRQTEAYKQLRVLLKHIWRQQGISGDGNPPGMAGQREGKRGGLLTTTGEEEAPEYWYAGMDTSGAQVGRMILCGDKTYISGGDVGVGGGCHPQKDIRH